MFQRLVNTQRLIALMILHTFLLLLDSSLQDYFQHSLLLQIAFLVEFGIREKKYLEI